MADINATLGADTTEFEKGVKQAGKTVDKELNAVKAGVNFGENLMSGRIGSAIGGLFGPMGEAIGGFVDTIISKMGELMERSRDFRNLSIATGLSVKELEGLDNLAKSTGISLHTLTNSFAEFNLKVANARIKGSELNNAFAKLNINFKDVTDGTFTATDGLKKLADAYTAGTDAQTLAYYGNLMYGSSFKDLLPLIKQGSVEIERQSKVLYKSTAELDRANALAADSFTVLKNSLYNFVSDLIGLIPFIVEKSRTIFNEITARMTSDMSSKVKNFISNNPNMTPQQLVNLAGGYSNEYKKYFAGPTDRRDQKEFVDELKKQLGGMGTKISPLGQSLAGAASTMQQMGGGDIFGAVSFSPLERIASATEETAKNTAPKNQQEESKNPFITNINSQ